MFENVEMAEDLDYIAVDVLQWRWVGGPFLSTESDRPVDLHDVSICKFLELGRTLRVSTFRPRARPPLPISSLQLAQRRILSSANHLTISSRLSNNSGKPSMDVAVSVLIKLVIDMYVLDSGTAAPLTLSMLEGPCLDLILNLGVHAHLLEPMLINDTSTAIEEEYSQESFCDCEEQLPTQGNQKANSVDKLGTSSAIDNFESWILKYLYTRYFFFLSRQKEKEQICFGHLL
ncbi:hypothetical protein NC651_025429 [Populus alba x Populus x berolinensis]|nr:hypothetical protein NC651_025429 [Populus alba x Populus x berolinensis]